MIATATVSVSPTEVVATPAIEVQYTAHKVVAGETLQSLARPGMTADQIQAYNHLHTSALRPGQPLIIPAIEGAPGERVLVQRGNTAVTRVAITLDAGASGVPTPAILKALHDRGVHVTFFLTGQWMREHPDLTYQIAAEGHEIANHSFHHPDFTTLDAATMLKELADTDAAARELTGHDTRPFFRPPYGAYNNQVLDTVIGAGYLPIYWTLDSLDSVGKPKTPQFLIDRVTTKLKGSDLNGAIFLMH
jgi:peptidoglycan/xylan/chitin deacetylase (PgdA/CDA1 family)